MGRNVVPRTSPLACALCGQSASHCDGDQFGSCNGIVYVEHVFGVDPLRVNGRGFVGDGPGGM